MDTLIEEPAKQDPYTDTLATDSKETVSDDTSSTSDKAEDAAILRKRLADKDRYIKDLEAQRKQVKPDSSPKDLAELEWKLENKDRISLVQEDYEKILAEGYEGEKVSKKIALELAEKRSKVNTVDTQRKRQDDISHASGITRNVDPTGYEDELDQRLGLTAEQKRKLEARHPHLKM